MVKISFVLLIYWQKLCSLKPEQYGTRHLMTIYFIVFFSQELQILAALLKLVVTVVSFTPPDFPKLTPWGQDETLIMHNL